MVETLPVLSEVRESSFSRDAREHATRSIPCESMHHSKTSSGLTMTSPLYPMASKTTSKTRLELSLTTSKTRAELERLKEELAARSTTKTREELEGLKKAVEESSKSRLRLEKELAEAKAALEMKTARSEAALARSRRAYEYEKKCREKQTLVEKLFENATCVDVAFLCDATGSMAPWISAVGDQINGIATDVMTRYGHKGRAVRCAFIAYRDIEDLNHPEYIDFTDDLEQFKTFVSHVKASGGADECEDIFTALEQAARLSWRPEGASAKMIFHMGDAPCHGRRFHDGRGDSYPNGDPKERKIEDLLGVLKNKIGVHQYCFSHINETTKRMITEFKATVKDQEWFLEDAIANTSALTDHVVRGVMSSVSTSIAHSVVVIREEKASKTLLRPYTLDVRPPHKVDWAAVPTIEGALVTHLLPETIEDLMIMVKNREALHENTQRPFYVKVAPQPFDESGACRLPYHAKIVDVKTTRLSATNFVAKYSKWLGEAKNSADAYKSQMEVQSVAAFLAQKFSEETGAGACKLQYTDVCTFVGKPDIRGARQIFNGEPYLPGAIVKWCNNFKHVNYKKYSAAVHAFCHWTWHKTEGELMVVDIQGYYDEEKDEYMLFDPAIHCVSDICRFSSTNLGKRGMEAWFQEHKCNAICKRLGLTPHPKQKHGIIDTCKKGLTSLLETVVLG